MRADASPYLCTTHALAKRACDVIYALYVVVIRVPGNKNALDILRGPIARFITLEGVTASPCAYLHVNLASSFEQGGGRQVHVRACVKALPHSLLSSLVASLFISWVVM